MHAHTHISTHTNAHIHACAYLGGRVSVPISLLPTHPPGHIPPPSIPLFAQSYNRPKGASGLLHNFYHKQQIWERVQELLAVFLVCRLPLSLETECGLYAKWNPVFFYLFFIFLILYLWMRGILLRASRGGGAGGSDSHSKCSWIHVFWFSLVLGLWSSHPCSFAFTFQACRRRLKHLNLCKQVTHNIEITLLTVFIAQSSGFKHRRTVIQRPPSIPEFFVFLNWNAVPMTHGPPLPHPWRPPSTYCLYEFGDSRDLT